jgi:hypothetical protein
MVGTGADDAHANTVLLVPASIAIDNVDTVAGVEVVDSTLTVDLPDLFEMILSANLLHCEAVPVARVEAGAREAWRISV